MIFTTVVAFLILMFEDILTGRYFTLVCYWKFSLQASTLTQNGTGPIGPVAPRIYWSYKKCTGPTNFFLA